MKKAIQITILGVLICTNLAAQDISDAERLANLSYMKYASSVNCDSTTGSNLEHKICLNLEFQELDSIMNVRFNTLLKSIESDSQKREIQRLQNAWIENRRTECGIKSEGLRGHGLGITYLSCMVKLTSRRIDEN